MLILSVLYFANNSSRPRVSGDPHSDVQRYQRYPTILRVMLP